MNKEIEIPEGYTARIEGNKVILEQNDESIRNFLYEFIKVCGWSEKQFPPKEKVLAYLERQKEQNPAEWSEEDKMHLNNAILAAEKEWGAESCTAKFLKSLRTQPRWKPSKEQMEILQYLCEHSSHPNPDVMPTLESLYHDLQKQMIYEIHSSR